MMLTNFVSSRMLQGETFDFARLAGFLMPATTKLVAEL